MTVSAPWPKELGRKEEWTVETAAAFLRLGGEALLQAAVEEYWAKKPQDRAWLAECANELIRKSNEATDPDVKHVLLTFAQRARDLSRS